MSGWLGARVRVSPYLEVRSIGIGIVGFGFFARALLGEASHFACGANHLHRSLKDGRFAPVVRLLAIWNSFDFGFFGFRCLLERHPAHDDPALSQGTAISHQQKRENFALYMMQI
jgi:hypothetical protein